MPRSASNSPETEIRAAIAGYFCRAAEILGLPRSVALIYHAVFLSPVPLHFGDIVVMSGLSKASASNGLRLLERMCGVQRVTLPGDRRTYYQAEVSFRRLIGGFLNERLQPCLESVQILLERVSSSASGALRAHLENRLSTLSHWHDFAGGLLGPGRFRQQR